MKHYITGKDLTSREQQLVAIVIGIIEQSKPLGPIDLLRYVNPAPVWSDGEIQDAIANLLDNGRVQLTSDRKFKMVYR